jgi:hypothetical protein
MNQGKAFRWRSASSASIAQASSVIQTT